MRTTWIGEVGSCTGAVNPTLASDGTVEHIAEMGKQLGRYCRRRRRRDVATRRTPALMHPRLTHSGARPLPVKARRSPFTAGLSCGWFDSPAVGLEPSLGCDGGAAGTIAIEAGAVDGAP
jgi:hypothetical protein